MSLVQPNAIAWIKLDETNLCDRLKVDTAKDFDEILIILGAVD